MIAGLHAAAVVVFAFAMALAVAHALELPGKMRLPKETYFAVQRIYYPGFTIGGISEPVALLLLLALCLLAPRTSGSFWSAIIALAALFAMQLIYWVFIHPVNKVWMEGTNVGGAGSGFLKVGRGLDASTTATWQNLRNRWEYAHAARAVLALFGFVALVLTLSRAA